MSNYQLFDLQGRLVKTGKSTNQVEVNEISKGTYLLKTDLGETLKIVVN